LKMTKGFLSVVAVGFGVSFLLATVAATQARAQTLTVLHSFSAGLDGQYPVAGLTKDGAGNLYGTTLNGGNYGYGAVFETPPTVSSTDQILYDFTTATYLEGGSHAGLVRDSSGNLYGTTCADGAYGYGTVFELAYSGTAYTYSVLHNFTNGADGGCPLARLLMDKGGNLYGTAYQGGTGHGTVFELACGGTTPCTYPSSGFSVLHSFQGSDGSEPEASLVMDGNGDLFGTTYTGGANASYGTVFELACGGTTPCTYPSSGFSVLYSFGNYPDAGNPVARVYFDMSSGNLYGTTESGGASGYGTVFKLACSGTPCTYPTSGYSILYSFKGGTADGANPYAGVVEDASGNLYGTTYRGGADSLGTVFELPSGATSDAILHSFAGPSYGGTGADGADPESSLLPVTDISGNLTLYGTTYEGGADGDGTVFSIGGLSAAAPTATLSTASLNFGDVNEGSSNTLSVRVTNIGNADLKFAAGAVTISPATGTDFSITADSCSGYSIGYTAPNNTCSVSVTFAPTSASSESATLGLSDNATPSTQTVSLSGTGVAPTPLLEVENINSQLSNLYPAFQLAGQQSGLSNWNGLFNDLQTYLVAAENDLSANPPNICDAIHQLEGFVTKASPYTTIIPGLGQLVTEAQSLISQLEGTPGLRCHF
jgi:uncharacterized repeat protein (TIGR03803 family)